MRNLDVDRIIAAARGLDPDSSTMRKVADTLGVDFKAVYYHVADKERLLALLVADSVGTGLSGLTVSESESWQDACSDFARRVRASMIQAGVIARAIRLHGQADPRLLGPVEGVLDRLVSAGASAPMAVSTYSYSYSYETLPAEEREALPAAEQIIAALG